MSIFFVGIILLQGLMHYYAYHRLSFYFSLHKKTRIALFTVGLVMWLATFLSIIFIRLLPMDMEKILGWIVFPWLGTLLLMFLVLMVTDIFTGVAFLSFAPYLRKPDRRDFIKRVIGITALGAVGGLSFTALRNGLGKVEVKNVDVVISKLPEAFDGFHIAQLSDMHIGPMHDAAWLSHIVEQTNALDTDLVAITGDLVDGSIEHLGERIDLLKGLRAKHGVYFITGNHEYYSGADAWKAYLQNLGIHVLSNAHVSITQKGQSITLAGVEDFESHRFPGHKADLPKALAGRDINVPIILLAHQPIAVFEATDHGVDLQLSGHTHGGQIRPFDYAVRLRQPYVAGLHRHLDSDTQIYVSSGTGFWGPPMRLGTAAEITSLRLRKIGA
jgi:predicted MPP superfamily phosphohydrolase